MDKEKLKKNIFRFYALRFFYALCFVIPVLVIFRQDNGLSMTEIMLLQSIYAISLVVLEVPSGYFADIFGRKKCIIISATLRFVGNAFMARGDGFSTFLIAELLFAIGTSCLSGADTAFVYDTLKDLGREKEYKKIWGNTIFIFLGTTAFAQIMGGIIGKYGLPRNIFNNIDPIRQTIIVSLPFLFIAIPFAFGLYEPNKHKTIIKKGYLKNLLVALKKEIFHNKNLLRMMIFFAFLGASYQFVLRFYQPYFKHIGLDIIFFGLLFGLFQLFTAIISKYAFHIEKKLGLSHSLLLSVIFVIISYIGMGTTGAIRGIIFCVLQQFVRGFYGVIVSDFINHRVSSTYRATILSIQNLGKSLIYALFLPIFGRIADIYSLSNALLIIGITIAGILIPLLIILYTKKFLRIK